MMEIDRAALEQHKTDLKLVLKTWEAQFRTDNGRRAGRDDIKANPGIASKYKEYQRALDILSGKVSAQKSSPSRPKRERLESDVLESPSKRRRSLQDTPQKRRTFLAPAPPQHQQAQENEEDQPVQTPALKRTFLGPTPQRNGTVLGIFDSPPAIAVGTPSRPRTILGDLDANVAVTPSFKQVQDKIFESPDVQYEERARGSRTPASTGKRFMLDAFMTPSHNRRTRDENQTFQATPSSVLKTPAFLRRDNFAIGMSAIVEEDGPTSPQMVRQPWQKRNFGRSLSGMIRDIRREQEAKEDEELDLLREMEDEAAGISVPSKAPPKIMVQDSQAGLDRDGFVPSDVEAEEDAVEAPAQVGLDGKPRKPWKKKGLKRQTRRVNMRPVAKKVQDHLVVPEDVDEDDNDDAVQETQRLEDMPSDIEDASEDEYNGAQGTKQNPQASAKSKEKPAVEKKAPTKRKVKPDAHANYRALKIKNKNSKAKGNGRFGRRR